jgi:hypothetical protein
MQGSTGVRNAGRTQQALRGAGVAAKMTPAQTGEAGGAGVGAEVSALRLTLALPALLIWRERTEDLGPNIHRDVDPRPPQHAGRSRFGPSQH